MDTLVVDKLFEILKKEIEIYGSLEQISSRKTDIIVEGKVSELENIVKLEQSMVVKIAKLEDKREQIVNQLSEQLNIQSSEVTISELVKYLGDEQAEKLKSFQDKMVSTLNKLKDANQLNSKLIKNSLDYIDFSINLITAADAGSNNYGNSGQVKDDSKKRNFFDARL